MNLWVTVISLLVKRTLLQALHAAELPESEGFTFSWRQLQLWADVFRNLFRVRPHCQHSKRFISVKITIRK